MKTPGAVDGAWQRGEIAPGVVDGAWQRREIAPGVVDGAWQREEIIGERARCCGWHMAETRDSGRCCG